MVLTAEEARVLGCLLEKERTTPDVYPLSLNALVAACNQSTNRAPVVHFDEDIVERALDGLREHGMVRRGVYPGSRVIKYRHVLDEVLRLSEPEAAILCLLLLRGPQTPGELKGRAERLHAFADLAAVDDAISALVSREDPLARRLEREPGQKETRVRELLGDDVVSIAVAPAAPGLAERVAALEGEVATLRDELERLRDSLGG